MSACDLAYIRQIPRAHVLQVLHIHTYLFSIDQLCRIVGIIDKAFNLAKSQ